MLSLKFYIQNTTMPSNVHLIVVLLTQLHFTFCGQDCLSCTNIASPSSCHYTLTCADNEVCYKHKFISHSGSVSYDLGCAYQQTCSHLTGSIFGKRRSEGRRQICSECCNSTRLCNRDLPCFNTVSNGTILPRECSDIADVKTGVYDIYPDGVLPAVTVYCVVNETKRWTVIQRRINGCTDFYRGWEAYKEGFGNSSGEYWLGNENIHKISSHGRHALRVELSDFDNQVRYAEYEMFSIGDERDGYQLAVGGYSGNAGDSLIATHNGMKFSTFDRDNDIHSTKNCAEFHGGAWWYRSCYSSNLNGKYLPGRIDYSVSGDKSVVWRYWHGDDYGLKSTKMMIRKY